MHNELNVISVAGNEASTVSTHSGRVGFFPAQEGRAQTKKIRQNGRHRGTKACVCFKFEAGAWNFSLSRMTGRKSTGHQNDSVFTEGKDFSIGGHKEVLHMMNARGYKRTKKFSLARS
jgi:hypothetical protein